MFRHSTRTLSRSIKSRTFSTETPAPADDAFTKAWRSAIPDIEPPKTPLSFMQPRPPAPSDIPSKLAVNLVLPYAPDFLNKEVDMVVIPATTGEMGILPGHVSTITELKSGVLSVHDENGVKKYFVSGGFAYIHSNSYTDIIAAEAVPIDQLDDALALKRLAEYNQKLNSASTDLEIAEAQIGIDVYRAINVALSG
ncbi:OLC1v1000295C1 [Oldenlandia corymbosa var. corymbosa]|uniref:OLC1v1000295C1 n=1 Tax=Oldenlandia corymbosa var. corymbosa TaxID=529605 RepID=A0AAV1D2H9_OLDCO|nr:OLC1v1000295C1 [Oldenlandia corymbosa var. corymbosa]